MMKKSITLIVVCGLLLLLGCQTDDIKEEKIDNEEASIVDQEVDADLADDVMTIPKTFLQKNDESSDVLDLQKVLSEIGYPIQQTGIYDEMTVWAITDIQLQDEALYVTGLYDQETQDILEKIMNQNETISVGAKLDKPSQPDILTDVTENPYDVLALVNKSYALPNDYEPFDLTVPDVRFPFEEDDPKKQLRKVAADALEDMFAASDEAGVELYAQSGYRSFARQEAIFASNVERHGEEHANTYSARPGESEHQTGLVMDVTSRAVGFTLEIEFEDTPEGKWIIEHAHKYGFIIRYPKGKESITEYQYEPWHLRYVGVNAATAIKNADTTLEEYLGDL